MASTLEEVLFPDWNRLYVKTMRAILAEKRAAGHPYLDIKREGRRVMFYCCLCCSPCYDKLTLECHLKGNRHAKKVGEAQKTLMKPSVWPFNDGMYFVHVDASEEVDLEGTSHELVIRDVLQNNRASDLVVMRMGFGLIRARSIEKDNFSSEIHRIWCEWFGKDISTRGRVPEHDVAVVTFPYDYNLGRNVILDPGYLKSQDSETKSQLLLRKSDRKRLLDQFDVALERACCVCTEKFLPGKDVAALLNRISGQFVCSSRNLVGAFHLFHVSCLVHWILHCELEMRDNKPADEPIGEDERPTKRRKMTNEQNPKTTVYCPDCKGSGIEIHKKALEKPTVSLREICESKIEIIDGHEGWLRSPEQLDKCSIGFTLPTDGGDETEMERIKALKWLPFYRAKNSINPAPAEALGGRLVSLMQ